jgi:hypothetical protein
MSIPKFDPKELDGQVVTIRPGMTTKVFNYPVSPREAYRGAYQKKAVWQITGSEQVMFSPAVNPDNIARAFVFEANRWPPKPAEARTCSALSGNTYPCKGGSNGTSRQALLEDANEWKEKVVWPDVTPGTGRLRQGHNGIYLKDDNLMSAGS